MQDVLKKSQPILQVLLLTLAMAWPTSSLGQILEEPEEVAWTFLRADDKSHWSLDRPEARVQVERSLRVQLDPTLLEVQLGQATLELSTLSNPAILKLPTPEGQLESFEIFESPIMHPDLQRWMETQGWPMRTFKGTSLDFPATTVRLDWGGPAGFHAMVLSAGRSYFVDPLWENDRLHYVTYYQHHFNAPETAAGCNVEGGLKVLPPPAASEARTETQGHLRTYRLAVAATGEYTEFHGGTAVGGQAGIITTMNRVNTIFERDLSIRMSLIAGNEQLVYVDAASDPYTNGDSSAMLDENQDNLDQVIGDDGYDIGHVFGLGGGGLASLGSPCDSGRKARGMTGDSNPIGDPFDINLVAHEFGHQWGGNHTFNATTRSCDGSRNADTAYEPGAGSSIQAYAGICGDIDNFQADSDAFFHGISLDEMLSFSGGDGNCSQNTSAGNPNAPSVEAGPDYTIPISTPFELTATGSDLDGNLVTYSWEQFDLGPAASLDVGDTGSGPLFRSFIPTVDPSRTFPKGGDATADPALGERLPTTDRTMTFRVTARDNAPGGGRVAHDSMTVTSTTAAGPFQVTFPNGGETLDGTDTITWEVAGTDLAPVKATSVDILLSLDSGKTWTLLVEATPNDGSEDVAWLDVDSAKARIQVKATDNIFFDVSDADFSIGTPIFCQSPQLPTQDNGAVEDTMTISEIGALVDLDLRLNIAHTWVGDLSVTLEHVDTGISAVVIDRPGVPGSGQGCDHDNIEVTLDDGATAAVENQCMADPPAIRGTLRPNSPLGVFTDLAGTWKLIVEDAQSSDGGFLNEWCLITDRGVLVGGSGPDDIFYDGFESGRLIMWSSTMP